MANTWNGFVTGRAFAVSSVNAGLLNAGSRVLRLRRVGMLNNQTSAVTGVICLMELRWYSGAGWTTPTSVSAVAHDSTNSPLSSVTHGYAGTPTGTSNLLRRILWSSDEAGASVATNDELECLVPLNIIWDAGYANSNVQPLTLRTNESFMNYNTAGAAGLADHWMEFTDEAT